MLNGLTHIPHYFLQPVRLFKTYNVRSNIRPDLIAGLTVAIIALPQAIAFALIAELPPEMGLYATIIGVVVGALWGSSNQLSNGPANAISLLVFSSLAVVVIPGTPTYLAAAGLVAVLAGIIQVTVGLARLGVLVNFVSHSVIIGFSAGAGILIMAGQLEYLLGVDVFGRNIIQLLAGILTNLDDINWATTAIGLGTIVLLVILRKINPKLPASLISIVIASGLVYVFQLDQMGVGVIGQLATDFPPLVKLPLFDFKLINSLTTGALAIAAISLIQTTAIVRSISLQTGQRTDNNQEFVGQGLANIACGFFSGYPGAGSFARSAVNLEAGAQTRFASLFAGLFLLIATLSLGSLTAYLPRAALAGILMVTAYGLIRWAEIRRIALSVRGDAVIMFATLFGTLLLRIEFAVLLGILLSFGYYIKNTSQPSVFPVLPDEQYKHFIRQQPHQATCPQLGILKISGDLYFGAVGHIEDAIRQYLRDNPNQRFLLLRMHSVNHCDLGGVRMLEDMMNILRERGGDLYLMRVEEPVLQFMQANGFYDRLGYDRFLPEEHAVFYLFRKVIDPSICIYECTVRAFLECQNLPKQIYPPDTPQQIFVPVDQIPTISPQKLQQALNNGDAPLVIDIREPNEFKKGHIAQAQLVPLPEIFTHPATLPPDRDIVLVCRGGWRSQRTTVFLQTHGYDNIVMLRGGMLAWLSAGLPEEIEYVTG